MYEVFISHKTAERGLLEDLVRALEEVGVSVYVAERDPWPGQYLYEGKILPAIRRCDCFLVLLTHGGAESPDVNQEMGIAYDAGKLIVPLVENGVRLTGVLAGREVVFFDRHNIGPALQTAYEYLANQAAIKNQQLSGGGGAAILLGLGLFALVAVGLSSNKRRR